MERRVGRRDFNHTGALCYNFSVSSAPEKPSGPSFSDLVGQVKPLKSGASRVPASGTNQQRPRQQPVARGRSIHVERGDGLVTGRASDAPQRLLDELRRGVTLPVRELDLHRMSAAQASLVLERSIKQARRDGLKCLVVICGRGTHSGRDGAVLPSVVEELLVGALAPQILAFCTAPPSRGGAGALLVRLRSR